jgi:hypothetical protein
MMVYAGERMWNSQLRRRILKMAWRIGPEACTVRKLSETMIPLYANDPTLQRESKQGLYYGYCRQCSAAIKMGL